MTATKLESILCHYEEFYALYEREGVEELSLNDGTIVNVHDVLRGINELPDRQRKAVILLCLMNMREIDVAPMMGFYKWTSPVSSYKREGLKKLVKRYWQENEDGRSQGNGSGTA